MDILSSSSSYPTSPSASVRWLIVSIPHSSPFQVDARGTAAASLLVLLFLLTLARWHWVLLLRPRSASLHGSTAVRHGLAAPTIAQVRRGTGGGPSGGLGDRRREEHSAPSTGRAHRSTRSRCSRRLSRRELAPCRLVTPGQRRAGGVERGGERMRRLIP